MPNILVSPIFFATSLRMYVAPKELPCFIETSFDNVPKEFKSFLCFKASFMASISSFEQCDKLAIVDFSLNRFYGKMFLVGVEYKLVRLVKFLRLSRYACLQYIMMTTYATLKLIKN